MKINEFAVDDILRTQRKKRRRDDGLGISNLGNTGHSPPPLPLFPPSLPFMGSPGLSTLECHSVSKDLVHIWWSRVLPLSSFLLFFFSVFFRPFGTTFPATFPA